MFNTRYQLDKIIITAMDRFVWFVLLVVTTHLVTEFTKVTDGYTKSSTRPDAIGGSNDLIINATYKVHETQTNASWPETWVLVEANKYQHEQQHQSTELLLQQIKLQQQRLHVLQQRQQ